MIRKACVYLMLSCIWFLSSTGANAESKGIVFECSSQEARDAVLGAMPDYLSSLGVDPRWWNLDSQEGMRYRLVYSLVEPKSMSGTLDLYQSAEFNFMPRDGVLMPQADGTEKLVPVVPKKEIVMSMLHSGRTTLFAGKACDIQALKDQVGLRQNIVMWSSFLAWEWPNGEKAWWNPEYWKNGDLIEASRISEAFYDVFFQPKKYGVGCYTATKIIVAHAILDYFSRVSPDADKYKLVVDRLLLDGDPLVGLEPRSFWRFEPEFDASQIHVAGKILKLDDMVAPRNFIPGGWAYMWNTDPVSYEHIGYEGSNAIYLGRNLFDDYYNDNGGSYKYQRKLDEVYQWRNGVFSRSRDSHKIKPRTLEQLEAFGESPERGGFVLDYRLVPYQFGYEDLPPLDWQ